MTGSQELAILELERAAIELGVRVGGLERFRLPASEQGYAGLWYDPEPATAAVANTTFTGQVRGCGGFGLPSATVTLTAGGSPLWSGSTDGGGNYAGSISLGGSTSVAIAITPGDPQAGRFVTTATGSGTLSPGMNMLATITVGPASGYFCSGLLYYPLAATLHLTDSVNGAFVLSNTGTGWKASPVLSYPGCPASGCAAGTIGFSYLFNGTALATSYQNNPALGPCPKAGGTSTVADVSRPMTLVSSVPFLASGSVAAGNLSRWYCAAAVTFTLSE